MTEITKEQVKEAIREVIAEKFELTLGIDCMCEEDRKEMRKDVLFLRTLRLTAQSGGEKVFLFIIGIACAGAAALLFPEIWRSMR
jgi:hypothetical protein